MSPPQQVRRALRQMHPSQITGSLDWDGFAPYCSRGAFCEVEVEVWMLHGYGRSQFDPLRTEILFGLWSIDLEESGPVTNGFALLNRRSRRESMPACTSLAKPEWRCRPTSNYISCHRIGP
jgi:hypothetical protein